MNRALPILATALLTLFAATQTGCAAESGEDADTSEGAETSKEAKWSTEQGLEGRWKSEILPYFEEHATKGTFEGVAGKKVGYAKLVASDEKAAIVLFTGRAESYMKYAEVAYDLHRKGYSLFILDHRGQGFSERFLDQDKGHIDSFANYAQDAKTFVDAIVQPAKHEKTVAMAHSMGGAILADYLINWPSDFKAAVMVSPMFEIRFPGPIGEGFAKLASELGDDTAYALSQGPYKAGSENIYSHSAVRYGLTDGLNKDYPAGRLGGPTRRWIIESVKADQALREQAALPNVVRTPVLLLQGTDDQVVETRSQSSVCKSLGKACKLVPFKGAGHELLMEKDEFRVPTLEAIVDFVEAH